MPQRAHLMTLLAVLAVVVFGRTAQPAFVARAQVDVLPDLFDQTIVRDFEVQFTDADWQRQLDRAGESTNVRADLTVDGATYSGVGCATRASAPRA